LRVTNTPSGFNVQYSTRIKPISPVLQHSNIPVVSGAN
jgi:hypothetical protein